tara:strand:- start:759 stop:1205 length:447 start_codon:yes stop_codon:yes gene_type:complete
MYQKNQQNKQHKTSKMFLLPKQLNELNLIAASLKKQQNPQHTTSMDIPQLPNAIIMRIIKESTTLQRSKFKGVVDYFKGSRTVDFSVGESVTHPQGWKGYKSKGWLIYDEIDIQYGPESVVPQYFWLFEKVPEFGEPIAEEYEWHDQI